MVITKGKAYWAKLRVPDTKFDPRWCIDLEMSKEEAAKLKEIGLKVKEYLGEDDRPVRRYKFYRNVNRRGRGTGQNKPPAVVDPALVPFEGLIGNGSIVNVMHKPYRTNYKGNDVTGTDLQGVQILELIPYEIPEASGTNIEDGPRPEFKVEGESFKHEPVEGIEEVIGEAVEEEDEDSPF